MGNDIYTRSLFVNGNGEKLEKIPGKYQFITVLNNANYTIEIYRNTEDMSNLVVKVPPFTFTTIPLKGTSDIYEQSLLIKWSGMVGDKNNIPIYFTTESLQIAQSLAIPGGGQSVSISGDLVGLAKSIQLPPNLTDAYNFRVGIMEDIVGLVKDKQLPDALSPNGGLKVSNVDSIIIAELPSLPAGENNIGNVDVTTLPPLPAGANNIGQVDIASMPEAALQPAETPTLDSVSLVAANTEYSCSIPAGARALSFNIRSGDADLRFSFDTGKVAGSVEPYFLVPAGTAYAKENILLTGSTTIYFACGEAGKVVQVEYWI